MAWPSWDFLWIIFSFSGFTRRGNYSNAYLDSKVKSHVSLSGSHSERDTAGLSTRHGGTRSTRGPTGDPPDPQGLGPCSTSNVVRLRLTAPGGAAKSTYCPPSNWWQILLLFVVGLQGTQYSSHIGCCCSLVHGLELFFSPFEFFDCVHACPQCLLLGVYGAVLGFTNLIPNFFFFGGGRGWCFVKQNKISCHWYCCCASFQFV